MKRSAVSLAGWYGVLAILLAYALISFGAVGAHSLTYQLLNLTGAGAIIIEAYSKRDYQPTILNLVWLVVAAIAIIQIVVK